MKGYTKETKTTADGYTVDIYRREGEEPLPDPKTMTFQDYAQWIRTHSTVRRFFLVKKKGNDDAYYGIGTECVSRSGRKVFPKTAYICWLLWRGGKATGNAVRSGSLDSEITELIIEDRGLEALLSPKDRDEQYPMLTLLRHCLGQKSLLKKVLEGKVTNRHDLVKTYMKTAFGMMPPQYTTVERYMDSRLFDVPIADIRDFTTDPNATMLRILDGESKERQLLRDLIGDAVALDKKINPKWSVKRMHQEHQENIKLVLEKQLDAESDKSIYIEPIDITFQGYRFRTIDNARAALLESRTMHNCVFHNYWKKAEQRSYILFHVTAKDDEDMSLGYHIQSQDGRPTVVFDQMHTIYNGSASDRAKEAAHAFLEEHKKDILLTISEMNAARAEGAAASLGETADIPLADVA